MNAMLLAIHLSQIAWQHTDKSSTTIQKPQTRRQIAFRQEHQSLILPRKTLPVHTNKRKGWLQIIPIPVGTTG